MPFELGIACAFQNADPSHDIIVLERKPYRLQKTLSDYNGRDPIIHGGSRTRLLMSIIDLFDVEAPPDPLSVKRVLKVLLVAAKEIKRDYRQDLITTPGVYKQVVATGTKLAIDEGLISVS